MKKYKPVEFIVPLKVKLSRKDIEYIVGVGTDTAIPDNKTMVDQLVSGGTVRIVKHDDDPTDQNAEGFELNMEKLIDGIKKYVESGGQFYMKNNCASFYDICPPDTVAILEFSLFGKSQRYPA